MQWKTNSPSELVSIGSFAFQSTQFNCQLNLPTTLKSINKSAFAKSNFHGDLIIPDKLEIIGNKAFMNCSKFANNLEIPSSLITLGEASFQGCTGFNGSLTIGPLISSLPEDAFEATNFKSVHYVGTKNIENCYSVGGINPEIVFVTSNYEGESFCGKKVDKNKSPDPTMVDTAPESITSAEPDKNPIPEEKGQHKKLKTGAIIGIAVAVGVSVIAVVVLVIVFIHKKLAVFPLKKKMG